VKTNFSQFKLQFVGREFESRPSYQINQGLYLTLSLSFGDKIPVSLANRANDELIYFTPFTLDPLNYFSEKIKNLRLD